MRSGSPDLRIQFIDGSVRLHSGVRLLNPSPSVETRLAFIACSRVCLHPINSRYQLVGKERDFKLIDPVSAWSSYLKSCVRPSRMASYDKKSAVVRTICGRASAMYSVGS